ncbi:BEL1-like homeodomain protein 2 [Sesamum alatum]|uniref:BEL1-like homeodomain protein 2 n=2 Tax=Sesamum TaxID=4181 RepID=A0AAE2CL90_9LAMI|nr:BEL1-like homeodomain protein 2 [Sesamum alatum]
MYCRNLPRLNKEEGGLGEGIELTRDDDDDYEEEDMGIATPSIHSVTSKDQNSVLQFSDRQSFSNSMSQDFHQGIFSFSNGLQEQQQQQHHLAQQIPRDKLRVQGFNPPPPLVGVEEEEPGGLPVYETAGMLSEMFNLPSGGAATATELLESQISQSYRNPRAAQPLASSADWFSNGQGLVVGGGGLGGSRNQIVVSNTAPHHHHHHHNQISRINGDSAAAMQLFLMNPQQQRSPSPSPPPPPPPPSSTLHMLLPHPSSSSSTLQAFQTAPGGALGQFTWVSNGGDVNNPNEIPAVVEGQGLSLSLSSSLQRLETAKPEELRMGEGGLVFFGPGGGGGGALHLQGGLSQNHQLHVGLGSSFDGVNMLRNSKYAKAAQELLEEFCSVGRGQFKRSKLGRQNDSNRNPNSNPSGGAAASGGGGNTSSSKDLPPLSSSERLEHQRRKVDRRYNHYCDQMQMVVNSFDMVMGLGAAVPYTCLAQKAMSRHFRCLKDAISDQLKHSCELLGEKDAAASGLTKGETPRLRMLEQSLRQQRAFNQMGMMEQEAWRPQRGLPERSVNILRAWLFEHFLNPYPSDADKLLLARQTGLSRNQVSNWFINARVRLWKPMVEEMYQQEAKDETEQRDRDQSSTSTGPANYAQTPTPPHPTTVAAAAAFTPPPGGRSEINAHENDPSFVPINAHCFSENQAKLQHVAKNNDSIPAGATQLAASSTAAQPPSRAALNAGIQSRVMRLGTSAGDVSLTLGLRHAGNPTEKGSSTVRDFGG